jgi:predicted membrane channel-forming protein YqfA (hemolysin III family)
MPISMFTGSLIFSHILPVILGFIAVVLMISGIMDNNNESTKIGIVLFIIAAIMPFLILGILI